MNSKGGDWDEKFKIIRKGKRAGDYWQLENLYLPVNIDFDELEIIGDHIFGVAIPYKYRIELKRNIIAAMKAYEMGNKSIDYVLKKYGHKWQLLDIDESRRELYRLLQIIKDEVESIISSLSSEHVSEEMFGRHIAQGALIRLKSSFRSATLLISRGYSIETIIICRLILEQIAWVYSIYSLKDKESIFNTKPSKAIANLKKIIPMVGKLYGWLNIVTQLDPEYEQQYIGVTDEGQIVVSFYIPEMTLIILHCLITLADIYRIISETIFSNLFDKLLSLTFGENTSLVISNKRPLSDVLVELMHRIQLNKKK